MCIALRLAHPGGDSADAQSGQALPLVLVEVMMTRHPL